MGIECPWCGERVRLRQNICPACNHEVLPEHLEGATYGADGEDRTDAEQTLETQEEWSEETEINPLYLLEKEFSCKHCGHDESRVKEIAMTGAGLSKLLDIQHNHYWFASCLGCGVVTIYDPEVLRDRKEGGFGTVMDILF